jgi:hypothetical protein
VQHSAVDGLAPRTVRWQEHRIVFHNQPAHRPCGWQTAAYAVPPSPAWQLAC